MSSGIAVEYRQYAENSRPSLKQPVQEHADTKIHPVFHQDAACVIDAVKPASHITKLASHITKPVCIKNTGAAPKGTRIVLTAENAATKSPSFSQ